MIAEVESYWYITEICLNDLYQKLPHTMFYKDLSIFTFEMWVLFFFVLVVLLFLTFLKLHTSS